MIELEFIGGARTVTGSKHVLRTSRTTILLECGLFQGPRRESMERNRELSVPVDEIQAVVLSHAHIDHSGALPLLHKHGYDGPVYTTPATRDLMVPMLEDAAMIQESDARFIQRLIEKDHADIEPVEPLFSKADVIGLLEQVITLPYHRSHTIAPGIQLTFLDAGHVLGSAVVVLDIEDEGERKRFVFTGDLGRRRLPILRDPQIPEGADYLMMESTYGDRMHDPVELLADSLLAVVKRTVDRKGKLIIPSFALERAQEIIYVLKQLQAEKRLPKIPVYVDSPLTVRLTDVFKLHPDCYDGEAATHLWNGNSPFEFEGLTYVSDVEGSKAIDAEPGPSIIIAASGMCEAGRVLHHLRAFIGSPKNTVLIVGFQAPHTLGRRLVEKRTEVKIFGIMHRREAEVVVLNGFSAHADQAGLVEFAGAVRDKGRLARTILVHGEPSAQAALTAKLSEQGISSIVSPGPGERLRL
jgi:metallo-beta-lactamase family protein